MDQVNEPSVILTEEMVEQVRAAVMAVATGGGWGRVTIIMERGQPVRVQTTTEEWLARRR